jgi:hypothetical protein
MLTASEVATALNVKVGWVYRHKYALGGFQPEPGAAVLFSENCIEKIKDGAHAIPNEKRGMAGQAHDFWASENKGFQHKAGGKKMGSRAKRGKMDGRKLADHHNLLT